MDDSAMFNEEILQQQQQQEDITEEAYQQEIVRLRTQLAASQQAEKLVVEQLMAQQS
jgi:hypothetical protein